MNAITGFMGIATSAVLAGAGNSVATETKEKNIRWFVMCEQCTALTCGALKGKAIEEWNRRASDGRKERSTKRCK